ncbi:DUF2341 domain-containing protein [Chloroflexus sp.]|uniref:DUF2341 domain-containing protein n=1 Tax=Chloroflexus sp. TaxID=1904827 RepID=UPI002ACE7E4B|nr:DUF2341 domain-containing protein [Chloroflexus sp.]
MSGMGFSSIPPEINATPKTRMRLVDMVNQAFQQTRVTSTTTAPLYNYPVQVTLDTTALIAAGKLRPDCGDLRFADEFSSLDYWLESGCNTATTRVWVKVPHLPVGTSAITATYGNALHTSASSSADTFLFFDDFQDGVISPFWNISIPSGAFSTSAETGGQLRVTGQTTAANQFNIAGFSPHTWKLTLPQDVAIDTELSIVNGPDGFKAGLGTMLNLQGSVTGGSTLPFGKAAGKWSRRAPSPAASSTGAPSASV